MSQTSSSSTLANTSAVDVAASQQDACERMQATTNVATAAIDELCRMANHRVLQSVATLRTIDKLVCDPQVLHLITPTVDTHLLAMQEAYHERIAVVEENAANRLITLADWMPPRSGFLATLRQLITFHIVFGREPKVLSVDDVIQGVRNPTAATEGVAHASSTQSVNSADGLPDQHRRVHEPTTDHHDPVGRQNGSAGDIEGVGWRIIRHP